MTLLVDALLRSSTVVLIAWLAAAALRRGPADLRRRLWLAVVGALALMPAARWLMPPALSPVFFVPAVVPWRDEVVFSTPIPAAQWMTIAWAAGMVFVLGRVAIGLVAIVRLTRQSTQDDGTRYSNSISTPMTWGVFRPVVLLPAYTLDWTEKHRSMLIQHEQAHVAHHDWLWQMLTQYVCAVLWFNPLVWLAARHLRRECERAADDRVLAAGTDAPAYAAQLLRIARMMQRPALSVVVAMAGAGSLEHRVYDILDESRHRASRPFWRLVVVAMMAVVCVPLAALQNSQRAYHVGDEGLTPPVPTVKVKPSYTREAMRARIEGIVTVSAEVSEQGLPEHIQVVQPLDDGLDANAVASVAGWRFEPGRKDGTPVRVAVEISVEYTLK